MYASSKSFHQKRAKEFKSFRCKLTIITLLLLFIFIFISIKFDKSIKLLEPSIHEKIYNSMNVKENRINAYNKALYMNGGNSSNTCVYFLAEVLRVNGEKIEDTICNTQEILSIMKKRGFKMERDYKKLKPGDICFTTDNSLNQNGTPTHTYIFMQWKEQGKYDYAYICDNQAKDYNGKIYHLRNIRKVSNVKGNIKEPFSFFMRKE